MKELVRFELYKLFSQKGIYITAAILLFLIIFFHQVMPGPDASAYSQYKKWEGPVTEQKLQEAKQLAEQGGGRESEVYQDLDLVANFQLDKANILKEVTDKLSKLNDLDSDASRQLQLEKKLLSTIHFTDYYYQWPVEQMQDYINTFGFIFLGTLILIGLSSLFTRETASGVDQYILSTQHGRKTIVHAKLVAALIFVLACALLSIGFDVVYWIIRAGNYGWLANIHSIPKYYNSPYTMNMLSFFLLKTAVHVFAGLMLAICVVFISLLSKNSFFSFICSGFVFAFPFMAEEFVIVPGWLAKVFQFSYVTAMRVDNWFTDFHAVTIFGYPLLLPIAATIVLLLVSALFTMMLYKINEQKQIKP